jgi:hypothetical protein
MRLMRLMRTLRREKADTFGLPRRQPEASTDSYAKWGRASGGESSMKLAIA